MNTEEPEAAWPASHAPADDPPATPPRRRGVTVALAVTSTLLAGAVGLAGYLYWTTDQWRGEADALTDSNAALEQEVAALTSDLEQTRAELESANERLRELAGEHARTTDERELLEQLADRNAELAEENAQLAEQQNEIAVAATTAASRLSECATSQDVLLTYVLEDRAQSEIRAQAEMVDTDCRAAQDASAALARMLEG